MRFSRFHAIASMLLACSPALVSCGSDSAAGGPVTITSNTPSTETSAPANVPAGLPNRDPQLFKAATPCKLVTSDDLQRLFQGTFRNVLGTDDSPVTDLRTTTRGCGYSSSDARIEHENSYDTTEVAFTIETSLDDKTGTLWQAELQAMSANGGQHAAMPGADDLISFGPGWYAARNGQVIIEIRDEYSELTNAGAKSILAVALNRLP